MLPPPRYPHCISLEFLHPMLRASEAHRCKAHRAEDERRHVSSALIGPAFPGSAATLCISASMALLSLLLQHVQEILVWSTAVCARLCTCRCRGAGVPKEEGEIW